MTCPSSPQEAHNECQGLKWIKLTLPSCFSIRYLSRPSGSEVESSESLTF